MPADSTVTELDRLYAQAKQNRNRIEREEWLLAYAFYHGQQWFAVDSSGRFWKPPMAKTRITDVDNRVQPAIRVEIARMTRTDPTFTVAPNTSDESDTNAAALGEQVMRYLWSHLNLSELTQKALLWSRICGAGFLKCYWDPTLGDSSDFVINTQTGDVMDNPADPTKKWRKSDLNGLPLLPGMGTKTVAQGDLRVEVRSPFQIFPDPLADSWSEIEWCIEESVKSAEYIQRRYGETVEPDTPANPGLIEARFGMPTGVETTSSYKGVKIREYWCKPCTAHPKGRRAVWVVQGGDKTSGSTSKLLQEDDAPFDPMPYVMLPGIPIPGRLWPTSLAHQLRNPQTKLNKINSQLMENAARVGNPTLAVSMQAVQDYGKFSDSLTLPGGILPYNEVGTSAPVPSFIQAPPLPEYIQAMVPQVLEAIQEISGQHDVSTAQVPPGVTAAAAIQLLQEADDTRLGPAMRDFNRGVAQLGQKLLTLVARYYTDLRTIRLAGDDSTWQIQDFRGSQLQNNTRVEVQSDSGLSQSKALKQAQIQNLMTFMAQAGIELDPKALGMFLKDAELGGLERLIAELSESESQVARENVLLCQGMELPINSYDDNQAHVDGHQSHQRTAKYAQYSPQVKQIFEQHVEQHQAQLAQQAMQQQQLAIQAQQQASQPPPGQMQMQFAQQQAQMQQQAEQAQQQQALQAASQGQQSAASAANSAQAYSHAEAQHQQRLRHAEELHQARLAQQQQRQGAPNGR